MLIVFEKTKPSARGVGMSIANFHFSIFPFYAIDITELLPAATTKVVSKNHCNVKQQTRGLWLKHESFCTYLIPQVVANIVQLVNETIQTK